VRRGVALVAMALAAGCASILGLDPVESIGESVEGGGGGPDVDAPDARNDAGKDAGSDVVTFKCPSTRIAVDFESASSLPDAATYSLIGDGSATPVDGGIDGSVAERFAVRATNAGGDISQAMIVLDVRSLVDVDAGACDLSCEMQLRRETGTEFLVFFQGDNGYASSRDAATPQYFTANFEFDTVKLATSSGGNQQIVGIAPTGAGFVRYTMVIDLATNLAKFTFADSGAQAFPLQMRPDRMFFGAAKDGNHPPMSVLVDDIVCRYVERD
jgi:hypothetical protein